MVCDKAVCERWCVTKSGVTKLRVAGGGEGGGGGAGGGAGYRIKNKNPTQRCGEKLIKPLVLALGLSCLFAMLCMFVSA